MEANNDDAKVEFREAVMNKKKTKGKKKTWNQYQRALKKLRERWCTPQIPIETMQ